MSPKFCLLLVVLQLNIIKSVCMNPGAQIYLTKKGLDYVNNVAQKIIAQQLKELEIPDFHISLGGSDYLNAEDMETTYLSPPTASYGLEKPNSLLWKLKNGAITIEGKWKAQYTIIFPIRADGTFKASATGISATASAAFIETSGKAQMTQIETASKLGKIDLEIHGGVIGWILNLFSSKISEHMRPKLEGQIDKEVHKLLEIKANNALRTLPTIMDLGKGYSLNYSLVQNPTVSDSWAQVAAKGEITVNGDKTPFEPAKIETELVNDRMLNLLMTEYVLNSFLYHAQKVNATKLYINNETFPEIGNYLALKCKDQCLGKYLPDLAKKYPDGQAQIYVVATTAPNVTFSSSTHAFVIAVGKINLMARTPGKAYQTVVQTQATINANITPEVDLKEEKIKGKAMVDKIRIVLIKSQIQGVTQIILDVMAGMLKDPLAKFANQIMAQGIPIPMVSDVELENVKVDFYKHTLRLSCDAKIDI